MSLTKNYLKIVPQVLIEVLKQEALEEGIKLKDIKIEGNDVVIPDYYQYVDSGRKPGGKRVPILALIKWIKNNNYAGDVNKLAYAIQTTIHRKGIKARPFIEDALIKVDFSFILNDIEKQWLQ